MYSDISWFPGCSECAFTTTRTSFCDPGNCTPDLLRVRTRASGCNAVSHRKACDHLHALGAWLSWRRMRYDNSRSVVYNKHTPTTSRVSESADPGDFIPDLLPARTRASGRNAVSHRKACDHLHALGAWLSWRRMRYDRSRAVAYDKHTPTTSRVGESAIRAVSFLAFSRFARVPHANGSTEGRTRNWHCA